VIPDSELNISTTNIPTKEVGIYNKTYLAEDYAVLDDDFTLPKNYRPHFYPSELRDDLEGKLENMTSNYKCIGYSLEENQKRNLTGLNLTYDEARLYSKDSLFCQGDPSDNYILGGYSEILETVHITENPRRYFEYKLMKNVYFLTSNPFILPIIFLIASSTIIHYLRKSAII
jgi:hypothetical protein